MSENKQTHYNSVLDLNAEGVRLMQQEKLTEAVAFFHRGLKTLLTRARAHPGGGSASLHNRFAYVKVDECDDRKSKRILISAPLPERSSCVVHEDVFLLFNRALLPSPEITDQLGDDSELFLQIMSGILLYNTGLTHHLHGLKKGDSQQLFRALELYALAETTLVHSTSTLPRREAWLNLGLMALVNNTGCIHAFFHSFGETGINCEELSLLLSVSEETPVSTNAATSSSEEAHHVFSYNVYFFQASRLTSASAA
jgi:hypothetical protein